MCTFISRSTCLLSLNLKNKKILQLFEGPPLFSGRGRSGQFYPSGVSSETGLDKNERNEKCVTVLKKEH